MPSTISFIITLHIIPLHPSIILWSPLSSSRFFEAISQVFPSTHSCFSPHSHYSPFLFAHILLLLNLQMKQLNKNKWTPNLPTITIVTFILDTNFSKNNHLVTLYFWFKSKWKNRFLSLYWEKCSLSNLEFIYLFRCSPLFKNNARCWLMSKTDQTLSNPSDESSASLLES